MADLTHPDGSDPDQAFTFRLRAGPKGFAERLHAQIQRAAEAAIEHGLDVRGEPRGWVEVGALRRNGKRPSPGGRA